jgi:hypothetical protein
VTNKVIPNDIITYEEAEARYGRKARFTEWDPMFAMTVRPPRADEILSESQLRVPDSKEINNEK